MNDEDLSLFALSGLKKAYEEVDKNREKENKQKEEEFWKDISETKKESNEEIDPFWFT